MVDVPEELRRFESTNRGGSILRSIVIRQTGPDTLVVHQTLRMHILYVLFALIAGIPGFPLLVTGWSGLPNVDAGSDALIIGLGGLLSFCSIMCVVSVIVATRIRLNMSSNLCRGFHESLWWPVRRRLSDAVAIQIVYRMTQILFHDEDPSPATVQQVQLNLLFRHSETKWSRLTLATYDGTPKSKVMDWYQDQANRVSEFLHVPVINHLSGKPVSIQLRAA